MDEETIARLKVLIEANLDDLLRDVQKGTRDTASRLEQMGKRGERAFQGVEKGARGFGVQIGLVSGLVSTLTGRLLDMASRGAAAAIAVGKSAIGMRSDFESAQTVFENMFGDKQAATAFLDQLQQKAADLKVPFSEASQFAKSILPDTGSVTEFNELLRLAAIGAKDANLPLRELIFSFNEAVSGDFVSIRDRLDIPRDVIGRIRDADDVTGALVTELNTLFTKRGVNDLSSFDDTLNGTIANLQVFSDRLLFIAGQPGFEVLRDAAQRLQRLLEENRPELEAMAGAIGDLTGKALDFVSTKALDAIEDVDTDAVFELLDTFDQTLSTVELLAGAIDDISLGSLIEGANTVLEKFNQALVTASQISTLAQAEAAREQAQREEYARLIAEAAGGEGLLSKLAGAPGLGNYFIGLTNLAGRQEEATRIAAAGQEAYNQVILDSIPALEKYSKAEEERKSRTAGSTKATEDNAGALDLVNQHLAENSSKAAEAIEKQNELLQKFGADLLASQEQINSDLEQNQQDHTEAMVDIDEDEKERRADINEKYDRQLADKRKSILTNAREDLAGLEASTDKAIAEERREFQTEERRETEDHLKEMRRLRMQYLFDLEDAVSNRDARAIVDLRRRFEQEKQVRTEDFETQQGRDTEDQDQRLREIRENERARSDEIIRNREMELQQLAETVERNRQEELAKAEESFAEQRAREQEQFDEKQTLLESQLARELEALAKSLAEQGDVTEEGAVTVLGKLADVFGQGEKIDQLMEAYRKRVADLASLTISIDVEEGSSSAGLPPSAPGGRRGPIPFQHGTRGTLITKPTLALLGETAPELLRVDTLAQMGGQNLTMRNESVKRQELDVNIRGLPPGMNEEAVAGLLIRAFREAGMRG